MHYKWKLLFSVNSEDDVIKLIKNVRSVCNEGGFSLTKFASNSKKVLHSIPETFRRNGVKDKDIGYNLPDAQGFGILWNVEADTLGFKIAIKEKPLTRRGMLSTLSSIYDPLGLGAPFLLKVKKDNTDTLCTNFKMGWSSTARHRKWLEKMELPVKLAEESPYEAMLQATKVWQNKGNQHPSFFRFKWQWLWSGKLPASCQWNLKNQLLSAYLKSSCSTHQIHSNTKEGTCAATLAVKVLALLQKELQLLNVKETFWTDSEIVLEYIQNESRKFKVFVANRIEMIRDHTEIHQWYYIGTKDNPADYSSRGIDVANDQTVQKWFRGPSFLLKPETEWNIWDNKGRMLQDGPEIKKCLQINCISTGSGHLGCSWEQNIFLLQNEESCSIGFEVQEALKKNPKARKSRWNNQ